MSKTLVSTRKLMRPIAHFSHGVRVGNEIHLAATAGTDANVRLVGTSPGLADMQAQTERMLQNLTIGLELLGGHMPDVVRVRGFIADWRDFATWNECYLRYFKPPFPSRATVGSFGFPLPQLLIEGELIAMVGGGNRHLSSDRLPPALAPYAQGGVLAGKTHHCAVVPADLSGQLVDGPNPKAQSERILRNLADTLDVAGMRLGDVVMLNITLADIRDFPVFESVFRSMFAPPYPARSVVGAPLGLPGLLVEIESIAVAGGGKPIRGIGQPNQLGAASPAMLAGDHLYIGAQLGIDENGTIPPNAEAQTQAAWTRINALLREAGMVVEDVLRTNNTLTDWRLFRGGYVNAYGANVRAPFPPRATVHGTLLEPRACVQIEAIAHRGGRDATVIDVPA